MSALRNSQLGGFAPADRLLLEASRVVIEDDGAERIRSLLSEPIDWDAVLEASVRHGVAPLLARSLDGVGLSDDAVPAFARRALTALYDNSARRNRRLFTVLAEVVSEMRDAGAEPVGLKDIQLALEVFPDPALRPLGDIDLLVRQADWGAASGALQRLGFQPRPSADVPYILKYGPAQHFRRARDEVWIDLQWNVMQREWDFHEEGRFTWDGLGTWQRAVPMRVDGFELRVPVLEEMLFHLCLHLEGHGYSELILFCDIAELLRSHREELDWDALLQITRAYRSESSVYYVLLLAERLLGAPVPPEILDQLVPAYFHGALLSPVFGNLTQLHFSLDEIRLAVSPPPPVMDELERVVRRQTARALSLDARIDNLASSFLEQGGRLFIADGAASPRRFPDSSVPAFEPLHVFILDQDEPLMRQHLRFREHDEITTVDPVLAGERIELELLSEWNSELGSTLAAEETEGPTNARSALSSLRAHAIGSGQADLHASVHLVIHALSVEELVVAIAHRLGSAREDRLFGVCAALDLLRGIRELPCDAGVVEQLARAHAVLPAVSAGLAIADGIAAAEPLGMVARPGPDGVRVLEWARYGPSSMRRYPWLRRAYYFMFSLLATDGIVGKFRYLRRCLFDRSQPGGAVLPSLAKEVMTGVLSSRGAVRPSLTELAHWLEPETASRFEQGWR